jgi:hypothetical protein
MAVVSVKETWDGRGGEKGRIGENRLIRTFLVLTDSKLDTPHAILSSGMVPVPYSSTHPANALLLCRRVSATQKAESPFAWDVEAEYTDERSDEEDENPEENPLLRPVDVDWDSVQYQKPFEKTIDDRAVVNSAEVPFDPPLVIDDARWVVTVTANVADVPAGILGYNNRINDDAITVDGITFPARTVKVQGIRISRRRRENAVSFRQFTFQLNYRSEGWLVRPLDRGFQQLDGGKLVQITDRDDKEVSEPAMLNGSGGVLRPDLYDDTIPEPDPLPEPVYLEFKGYFETDLTVLPGVT